jgi:hypothetical protein
MEDSKEILEITTHPLKTILDADYNKAVLFNEEDREKIAKLVIDTYDIDKLSREKKETRWKKISSILDETKVVQKEGDRRANVIYPLIKQACRQWAKEAYPLLFQNGNVVKAKVVGNDDGVLEYNKETGEPLKGQNGEPIYLMAPGQKVEKADRRVEFDNFIFAKKIEDYECNFDKLLSRLPALGTYFKKLYYSKDKKLIKADILFPQSVIVNYYARDNEYTIYSEELPLDVNTIKSKQNSGIFLDVDLKDDFTENEHVPTEEEEPNEHSNYTEAEQLFIEQHRWLDLDGDGFMEPYIVIVHKDSQKLVGLYVRYTEDDIVHKDDKPEGKIVYIKAKKYYIKYGFIPSNDGSFYDEGFGDLLFHTNNVVDTLLNQLIDAGTLANSSQGFISKTLKQRAGNIKVKPGTYDYVETFGTSLRDSIMPIDHKEPSIVLFQLLQFILSSSKELVGVNPAFSQDMNPNLAPTTMMALVEEGAKEFKALYKRIYRSLAKEINMVEDIIRDESDTFEPMYTKVLDDEEANFEKDYNNETYDIIPISDVEVITSFEKRQKSMFLLNLLNNQILLPYLNVEVILRKVLVFANCSDIGDVVQPAPPPQTDPRLEIEQMKLQLKEGEIQLKEAQIQSETAVKVEKEKSERLRIQIANQDQVIKQAEGALKAKELDYRLAEMEANIENIVADSIQKYANANKLNAEAGKSTEDTENKVEDLYQPK